MEEGNLIYLDHHSATRPCSRSIEQLNWLLKEAWGSFRSPHQKGQQAIPKIQHEISFLHDWLGADPEDLLIFDTETASIDVLNEMIFFQLAKGKGKNHLALPSTEYRPEWQRWKAQGCVLKEIPATEKGTVDLKALDQMLGPRCGIFSVSWAHPFTGVMQPIEEIAKICKDKEVFLHVDASLILGKISLSLKDLPIDFLTFSGSFIHAPSWTKALIVKRKHAGSFSQERYFNPATALSLIEACRQLMLSSDQMAMEFARLRMNFMKKLNEMGAQQLFGKTPGLNNHCLFTFEGVSSEALAHALNERGVCIAYSERQAEILNRCHFSEKKSQSALAFTLSRYNTEEELERAAQILFEEYEKLKTLKIS